MATTMTQRSGIASQAGQGRRAAPGEESPHARTWMCWPSTASIYGASASYYESVQ
jgi:hypothetical protein